jgi:hypothetical protein
MNIKWIQLYILTVLSYVVFLCFIELVNLYCVLIGFGPKIKSHISIYKFIRAFSFNYDNTWRQDNDFVN